MNILTADEMYLFEQTAFKSGVLSELDAMERAGQSVAEFALSNHSRMFLNGVLVLCGRGNNGGDGFVTARILLEKGVQVEVLLFSSLEKLQGEAKVNALRFVDLGGCVHQFFSKYDLEKYLNNREQPAVVIDAVFGIGLKREIEGLIFELLSSVSSYLETNHIPVIAVDIPSGVCATSGMIQGVALRASATVSFQHPKRGHFEGPGAEYRGALLIADIGLPESNLKYEEKSVILLEHSEMSRLLQKHFLVSKASHKGSRGKVLIIGGTRGKYGAPKLSAIASLHAGAGLVTLALPETIANVLAPHLFEIMCDYLPDDGSGQFSGELPNAFISTLDTYDAVVIGPGMGVNKTSAILLEQLLGVLSDLGKKVVLDADALTLLSTTKNKISLPTILLTPHPGEMARMLGIKTDEVLRNRDAAIESLSEKFSATVILKGAHSMLASVKGRKYISPFGCSLLGTAGSGDVLSGILGTISSRGYSMEETGVLGMYLHGLAGYLLSERQSNIDAGVVARDIALQVPNAMKQMLVEPLSAGNIRKIFGTW